MAVRYGTGLVPEGVVAETSRCACGSADATSTTMPAGTPGNPAGAVDRKVNTLTRLPLTLTVAAFTEPGSTENGGAYKLFLLSFAVVGAAFTASMAATNPVPKGEPAGQSQRPPNTSSTASLGLSSGLTTTPPGGISHDGSVWPTLERGSMTTVLPSMVAGM